MKYSDIKISERVKRKTPNEWRTMSNVDKICYALCMSFDKRKSTTHQDVIAAKQGAVDFLTYSKNAADNNQVEKCLANFHKDNWCSSGNGSGDGKLDGKGPGTGIEGPGIAAGDTGDGVASGKDGDGPGKDGDSNGTGDGNGVAQGVDITGTTPMQKAADQLEGLLNAEDWAGAKALLDSNSDLKALFPPEYQDMIDAAIQADIDAIETKKKADAQAAIQKQAKEDAKIAAEQAAAKKAAEEAEAAAKIAAERQRLADLAAAEKAEAERLKKLENEKAAAKAKAAEAAKIAAAEKAEAEKLEAAKIAAAEAEAERQRIADEEAKKAAAEADRLEKERLEKERLEKERLEKERLEKKPEEEVIPSDPFDPSLL